MWKTLQGLWEQSVWSVYSPLGVAKSYMTQDHYLTLSAVSYLLKVFQSAQPWKLCFSITWMQSDSVEDFREGKLNLWDLLSIVFLNIWPHFNKSSYMMTGTWSGWVADMSAMPELCFARLIIEPSLTWSLPQLWASSEAQEIRTTTKVGLLTFRVINFWCLLISLSLLLLLLLLFLYDLSFFLLFTLFKMFCSVWNNDPICCCHLLTIISNCSSICLFIYS